MATFYFINFTRPTRAPSTAESRLDFARPPMQVTQASRGKVASGFPQKRCGNE